MEMNLYIATTQYWGFQDIFLVKAESKEAVISVLKKYPGYEDEKVLVTKVEWGNEFSDENVSLITSMPL